MNEETKEKTLHIFMEKAPAYRTIHVTGIFGGITPQLEIQLALFNERFPFPQEITYSVTDSGIGHEIDRIQKKDIFREIEVNAIMSLETAKALQYWLKEKIDKAEEQQEKLNQLKKASDDV